MPAAEATIPPASSSAPIDVGHAVPAVGVAAAIGTGVRRSLSAQSLTADTDDVGERIGRAVTRAVTTRRLGPVG